MPSKKTKWVGKVTADTLNVRTWAGTDSARIKSHPQLHCGDTVKVCDTVKDSSNDDWYYVCIDGKTYGFVHSKYITRK